MVKEILLAYFRNGMQRGASPDALRDSARAKGYPAEDIEQALAQVSQEPPNQGREKRSFLVAVMVIAPLILIFIGVGIFFLFLSHTPVEKPASGFSFSEIVSNDVSQFRDQHLSWEPMRWVSVVVACEATVANDAHECDAISTNESREWCVDEYNDYMVILGNISDYFPDCSKLEGRSEFNGALNEKSCAGIQKKDCSNVDGVEALFCKAIVEDPSHCGAFSPNKEECGRQFTFARAIIFGNEKLCEHPSMNLSHSETCKGIVRHDCRDIFNRITLDLSTINYIKAKGEVERCKEVKTEAFREACLNTSMTYNETYVSLGAPFMD